MNYKISCTDAKSKYLKIEALFSNNNLSVKTVHLPAWRPGRYEIQNFAKYLRKVKAFGESGEPLKVKKIGKDTWVIQSKGELSFTMTYEFYADIKNAGGSYINDTFLYLNPINCLMYLKDHQEEACKIHIDFNANTDIASGMKYEKKDGINTFYADDFHALVDSPIMISSKIQHKTYTLSESTFHIWIKGKIEVPWDKVLTDFKKFTKEQIAVFGEFPEKNYHFMIWMMPMPYFHGVEHKNSTMMTLGPDGKEFETIYPDLLGLASHELFHTWNAKRIRPKELLPYDYSKENYFNTCFVAEGLTTFYGDWILYRSGVFSKEQYQKELETTLRRHFEVADQADLSLLESSYDLWLDGYEKGIPNRKASVYHKGAVAALLLHHEIQLATNNKKGIDDVLKMLWINYGKPYVGYSYHDYQKICFDITGKKLSKYFDTVIAGNSSLKKETDLALANLGFKMREDAKGFIRLENLKS
ncbi:MAG: putative metalloprotease with PDZ domain [Arcticibacterium sp.]|jgi:predicted metalloprotease with PDZ domain